MSKRILTRSDFQESVKGAVRFVDQSVTLRGNDNVVHCETRLNSPITIKLPTVGDNAGQVLTIALTTASPGGTVTVTSSDSRAWKDFTLVRAEDYICLMSDSVRWVVIEDRSVSS